MPTVNDPISIRSNAVKRAYNAAPKPAPPAPKDPVSGLPVQPAGQPKQTIEVKRDAPQEAVVPPQPAPAAPNPAPAKTQFDIQREQVAADRAAAEKARIAAVERAYSNRGLGDSGIMDAAKRAEQVQISREASARLNSIGENEAAQAYASSEADKARSYDAHERALDRAANKEQYTASLAQAKELATRGLDLQASAQALQEKGMNQEDARYYAGLSQAERLAMKGYSLQESAQELQKQGMSMEDARYYAGLSQAKTLAERGLTLDEMRLALTEKGMSQDEAYRYAQMAQQEKLIDKQNTQDIRKGILVDVMAKIDPSDPQYGTKIGNLLKAVETGDFASLDAAPKPAPAPTPSAPTRSAAQGVQDAAGDIQEGLNNVTSKVAGAASDAGTFVSRRVQSLRRLLGL